MSDFPQLKLQREIDRAERMQRTWEIATDILAVVCLLGLPWGLLVLAHGAGW